MIRPRVEVSSYQYEQLKKLKEKTGKPLSAIIQEVVSWFVRKKDYRVSVASSHLPKVPRDKYKTIIVYFP